MPFTPLPSEVLCWMQSQSDELVQRLCRWCEQNSGSYHLAGLTEMAALLRRDFGNLSPAAESIALPSWRDVDDAGNVVVRETAPALLWHHRPDAAQRVLLVIHYDTVYPPEARSTIRFEGRRLYAPGAADAKGGIAVLHLALSAIERFGLASSIGWSVALNPDEEIGSPTSAALLKSLAGDYDFGCVFEPALPDGSWVAGRKGSGNWTFVVRGRSAHAGRNPEHGRNAIVQAARLISKINALNAPDKGRTVNIGRIHGGGPLNRVPEVATVRFNVRIADADDEHVLDRMFHQLAIEHSGDGFECELYGGLHAPVKPADDAQAIRLQRCMKQAAEAQDRPVTWQNTGGACDGSKLAAFGLPNVDTLGPTGDHLHSPEEYCELDTLIPAAMTIVQAFCDFAANPNDWPTRL